MSDAALPQGGLVFPKLRQDFLSIHNGFRSTKDDYSHVEKRSPIQAA
jgi:hypothetical protein